MDHLRDVLAAVAIGFSLAAIVVGLLIQHSLAQARQGLAALDFNLQHFRHELADTAMRLERLEHMAHWPEAPLQTLPSERRLN
jgi:hypothetical protein